MKKIAWITDTTASLDKQFIEAHNIHVVSLNLLFGNEVFKEEVDMDTKAFYAKMANTQISPKTSQPAIGDFIELYEKLKNEYEVGIAVHASSQLSGTFSTSVQAAEIAGFNLIPIDSKIGSYPIKKMVERAVALEKEGRSVQDIVENIKKMTETSQLVLLPSNLEQLKKSGRLSNAQAILGALLKMNLIIKFDDGKVVLGEKVRTEKKAHARMMEFIDDAKSITDEICVIHGDDEAKAQEWKKEIEQNYPHLSVQTLMLCSVAGVHTGQGTMGLSWVAK